MIESAKSFLSQSVQERLETFKLNANRLVTFPQYVEKDFWSCIVLDVLFNRLPEPHPQFLFKGGTSLSKCFALIKRFSEDIDIVINRDDLGFGEERDPTSASNISNKFRKKLFNELRTACSNYVRGDLRLALTKRMEEITDGCRIVMDKDDVDGQTLLVEYPTLYPSEELTYVLPVIKLEAGARSAFGPSLGCVTITPFIADEIPNGSFDVSGIRALAPERTYLEKLLILHGVHYGYLYQKRLPHENSRISRHYYDVAIVTATDYGRSALSNIDLLSSVRNHNLVAFRQAWKQYDKAAPGSMKLVPQSEPRIIIERDYHAMQGMVLGEMPKFEWVMDQIQHAESTINGF